MARRQQSCPLYPNTTAEKIELTLTSLVVLVPFIIIFPLLPFGLLAYTAMVHMTWGSNKQYTESARPPSLIRDYLYPDQFDPETKEQKQSRKRRQKQSKRRSARMDLLDAVKEGADLGAILDHARNIFPTDAIEEGSVRDTYINWYIGALRGGQNPTHFYNYRMKKRKFTFLEDGGVVRSKYGANAENYLVRRGHSYRIDQLGHNNIYNLNNIGTNRIGEKASWRPLYPTMIHPILKRADIDVLKAFFPMMCRRAQKDLESYKEFAGTGHRDERDRRRYRRLKATCLGIVLLVVHRVNGQLPDGGYGELMNLSDVFQKATNRILPTSTRAANHL